MTGKSARRRETVPRILASSIAVTVICLTPSAALASGDPAVLWWAAGAIVLQVVVGVLLWRIRLLRTPVLAGYGLLLLGIWLWGLNVPGPDFAMVDAVLLGAPLLYVLGVGFAAMARARRRKQGHE